MNRVDSIGVEKNPLRQCGLSTIDMSGNPDIADRTQVFNHAFTSLLIVSWHKRFAADRRLVPVVEEECSSPEKSFIFRMIRRPVGRARLRFRYLAGSYMVLARCSHGRRESGASEISDLFPGAIDKVLSRVTGPGASLFRRLDDLKGATTGALPRAPVNGSRT